VQSLLPLIREAAALATPHDLGPESDIGTGDVPPENVQALAQRVQEVVVSALEARAAQAEYLEVVTGKAVLMTCSET